MTNSKTMTLELEEETWNWLDDTAHDLSVERSTLAIDLIQKGIRALRLRKAASQYMNGEISLERAAELAHVSIYDMMIHLQEAGIASQRRAVDIRLDAINLAREFGLLGLAQQLGK